MSDFFELLNPGLRHTREQRDLEKVLVVDHKKGGRGPQPLDLDSGKVLLVMPPSREPASGTAGTDGDPGRGGP